jgi:hypothetical protein
MSIAGFFFRITVTILIVGGAIALCLATFSGVKDAEAAGVVTGVVAGGAFALTLISAVWEFR